MLGAILFVIYVNDFHAKGEECQTISYVDDNADHVIDKNIQNLQTKAQLEADLSYNWLKNKQIGTITRKDQAPININKRKKNYASRQQHNNNDEPTANTRHNK